VALSDNELLNFDASTLAMADAGDARRLLREHGDVFRAQLVAARWLEGYRERRSKAGWRPARDEAFEAGVEDTLRDVVAHLRQGDFLPGGTLYQEEQKRKRDAD
jgi:hypothetical protein